MDPITFTPQDADEQKILELFKKAFELRRKKGNDYGLRTWAQLGSKGEFPYMYHKMLRLESTLWKSVTPNFESTEDSLLDIINYAFHTLILLGEEEKDIREAVADAMMLGTLPADRLAKMPLIAPCEVTPPILTGDMSTTDRVQKADGDDEIPF